MKKIFTLFLFFFLLLTMTNFTKSEEKIVNVFLDRLIESAKQCAHQKKDVLVVVENETSAILVLTQGKFKGVGCQVSRYNRRIGMDISGMKFLFVDKVNGEIIRYKYPYRFHSFYINSRNAQLSKKYFHLKRARTIKNTSEYLTIIYKRGRDTLLIPNLRIFDYRKSHQFMSQINIHSSDNRFFVSILEASKERARNRKDVLILMENQYQALIVFANGKFEGVHCKENLSNIKLGMNISGKDFIFIDKEKKRIFRYKYPKRFHSCYADSRNIFVKKDVLRMRRTEVLKNNLDFFEIYHQNRRRKSIFLNLCIFDYRD